MIKKITTTDCEGPAQEGCSLVYEWMFSSYKRQRFLFACQVLRQINFNFKFQEIGMIVPIVRNRRNFVILYAKFTFKCYKL